MESDRQARKVSTGQIIKSLIAVLRSLDLFYPEGSESSKGILSNRVIC